MTHSWPLKVPQEVSLPINLSTTVDRSPQERANLDHHSISGNPSKPPTESSNFALPLVERPASGGDEVSPWKGKKEMT